MCGYSNLLIYRAKLPLSSSNYTISYKQNQSPSPRAVGIATDDSSVVLCYERSKESKKNTIRMDGVLCFIYGCANTGWVSRRNFFSANL